MTRTGLMLGMLVVCWSPPVLAADRLTDRDVKALVARIEQGRDRFDDALDDRLKHSIVRDSSGEVNVDEYLDDFQESIDRLEARLEPNYAASTEAATLLRQASAMDAFFRLQPPGTRGVSEWNRLVTDLKTLAAAYGTTFPLTPGATVRRVGDRELSATLDEIARGAGRLKKSLDDDLKKDSTLDKQGRQAIVDEADQLSKDAKSARERVKDEEPSSAEAERVLARATALQAFIGSHQVPISAGVWASVTPRVQELAHAYDTSWSGAR